ncbi:hypothetical protein OS493_021367 [Desmophyllum pertusum]|uniref:Uncharacterized protein n=1 Tax=Desmophyllum pertusum TaxID=174260 RepID=A0A9X0CX50_9CNID|nr:hypothetical protein OS493_021367 [Desmophyllum pertusum]
MYPKSFSGVIIACTCYPKPAGIEILRCLFFRGYVVLESAACRFEMGRFRARYFTKLKRLHNEFKGTHCLQVNTTHRSGGQMFSALIQVQTWPWFIVSLSKTLALTVPLSVPVYKPGD